MEKLEFTKANQTVAERLIENSEKGIFNFLNLYSVYLFKKEKTFRKAVIGENCCNFIDGFIPTLFLSVKYKKRIHRISGPVFFREYLSKIKDKSILIIGDIDESERMAICKICHLKKNKIFIYNSLPFISPKIQFQKRDLAKLSYFIRRKAPDLVFVCVGNPRQEILAKDLLESCKSYKFICVGAALDFLLGRKREAPKLVRVLGAEWLYRLITDFKYSKKKVWRSLVALSYLNTIRLIK
jgi:exopolysaccharide biosynthesis WecB/TagA/CpsF family protein